MPRLARLDAPGVLHHIIIRGIERRRIFRDGKDWDDLLARFEDLIPIRGMYDEFSKREDWGYERLAG